MERAKFVFHLKPEFPPLAWVACVYDSTATIEHGKYVEVLDDYFLEGVWAEGAQQGGLANSDCVFGTGGQIGQAGITFVSSNTTTDYIYYYPQEHVTYVSNSLPLILRYADDRLDPKCRKYAEINWSVSHGFRNYISKIPTQKSFLRRLMHANLEFVGRTPTVVDKLVPEPFDSFDAYKSFLSNRIGLCFENARSSARKRKLHIYSTQSKGYDSTALNAIARKFGIDGVFTILKGKANNRFATSDSGYDVDDDGTAICEILGLNPISLNRREFERGILNEVLYWAGTHTTLDLNFCGIAGRFEAPALFLTGIFGDALYGPDATRAESTNGELSRGDPSGQGFSELRLQLGFIHMAAPFLGGERRPDIVKISASPEMSAWRLGGSYDRPIPRRICEEAGVPRNMFGQTKMASVIEYPRPNIPFGHDLRKQYFDFLRANGLLPSWKRELLPLVHSWNTFVSYKGPSQNIFAYYADRLVTKLTGGRFELNPAWTHLDGSVFCFAVNAQVDSYQDSAGAVDS